MSTNTLPAYAAETYHHLPRPVAGLEDLRASPAPRIPAPATLEEALKLMDVLCERHSVLSEACKLNLPPGVLDVYSARLAFYAGEIAQLQERIVDLGKWGRYVDEVTEGLPCTITSLPESESASSN